MAANPALILVMFIILLLAASCTGACVGAIQRQVTYIPGFNSAQSHPAALF
jgi:hypothetical protein